MTWSQPAYEAVARLVGARTGLTFPPNRQDSAEAGIRRAMARAGIADPARYAELLRRDDALDDLAGELTVGETYFFREPGQYEFIRREVLPDVRRRLGPEHIFRTWCAGCASGEEAYSLAILCARHDLAGRVRLVATDISRAALARARQAVYGPWSLRDDGAAAVRPYLTPAGKRYRLDAKIRHAVRFGHLNLALADYPSLTGDIWGMDLILCRNVLIYFDPDTVARVARRLFESLAEGGWLITASCDPPLADLAPFETVVAEEGVFYRRPGHGGPWSVVRGHWSENWSQGTQAEAGETAVDLSEVAEVASAPATPTRQDSPRRDFLDEAREALAHGDHERALGLTRDHLDDVGAAVLHVRTLAGRDPTAAEHICAAATAQHPLAAELHYLHALLLLDLRRDEKAAAALRRVLYLDRTLAAAQMTLGTALRRRGDLAGARRAYRNARDLCRARPADEAVPLADSERAGRLAESAQAQLDLIDSLAR